MAEEEQEEDSERVDRRRVSQMEMSWRLIAGNVSDSRILNIFIHQYIVEKREIQYNVHDNTISSTNPSYSTKHLGL